MIKSEKEKKTATLLYKRKTGKFVRRVCCRVDRPEHTHPFPPGNPYRFYGSREDVFTFVFVSNGIVAVVYYIHKTLYQLSVKIQIKPGSVLMNSHTPRFTLPYPVFLLVFVLSFNINPLFAQSDGWQTGQFEHHQDIGDPELEGSVEYNEEEQTYLVSAGGLNMWDDMDQFHFI